MINLREAAQMALDWRDKNFERLLALGGWDFIFEINDKWSQALRAALAQPEPEPVAWADRYDLDRDGHDFWVSRQASVRTGTPLYTAPPQREWVGLTDEEINDLAAIKSGMPLYKAIEQAIKEKNA